MSTSLSTSSGPSVGTSMSTSLSTSDRFSSAGRAGSLISKVNTGQTVNIDEIVGATGELPHIAPESLKRDIHLGRGSSFQVSRDEYHKHGGTPYYVAVKRFVDFSVGDTGRVAHHHASFLREVAVLLHPPIRTHGCFIQTIACGWDDRSSQALQPYLVLDYSIHGTLPQYLRRCRIPSSERQELALDVTSGLKFLHECGIIHGDIKPDNILVYDNTETGGDGWLRPQVAKLSDFSSARFSQDFQERPDIEYIGTPKYVAPEIDHFDPHAFEKVPASFSSFAKADIYSLGLLIWETMNNGESYIDSSQLLPQEQVQQYLSRIFAKDIDAIRNLALDYFRLTDKFLTSSVLGTAVKEATLMCLFGDYRQRGDLSEVLKTLAGGTKEARPRQTTAINRYNPLGTNMGGLNFDRSPNRVTSNRVRSPQRKTTYTLMPITSEDFIVRTPADYSLAVIPTAAPLPSVEVNRVSAFERSEFDVFKLAVMYHVGFGVEQQAVNCLKHLCSACLEDQSVARIFQPVIRYLQHELGLPPDDGSESEVLGYPNHSPYLPRQMSLVETVAPQDSLSEHFRNIDLTNAEKHLKQNLLSNRELFKALTAVCREGRPDEAIMISKYCCWETVEDTNEPNLCHWLANMDYADARNILENLDHHGSTDTKRSCINHSINTPLYSAEHHTNLFGTPLHWAVHAGNIKLVSIFISHGANVDTVFESHVARSHEPASRKYQPSFTPLDLAVHYHFAEIAELLIKAGGRVTGGDRQWGYSVFHMIGNEAMPFARILAHGEYSQSALQETIKVLKDSGQDINVVDENGETP
ncbi:serine/threonine protein kinase [Apiospora sp. TS-2023a]